MAEENELEKKDGFKPSAPVDCYTANGIKIIPGLRVRIIAPGHECESNVANPAFDGSMVLVDMHRGKKMVHPNELEAV